MLQLVPTVATRKIALYTRQQVAGMTPDGTTRRVSLHDPDAPAYRNDGLFCWLVAGFVVSGVVAVQSPSTVSA